MSMHRQYGEDSPANDWVRKRSGIKSDEPDCFAMLDVDSAVFRYGVPIEPRATNACNKSIQSGMLVETKSRHSVSTMLEGDGKDWQRDKLFMLHQVTRGIHANVKSPICKSCDVTLLFFGVFVMSFSGERPDESESLFWWRFSEDGKLHRHKVCLKMLRRIYKLAIRPDTFEDISTQDKIQAVALKGL